MRRFQKVIDTELTFEDATEDCFALGGSQKTSIIKYPECVPPAASAVAAQFQMIILNLLFPSDRCSGALLDTDAATLAVIVVDLPLHLTAIKMDGKVRAEFITI
jgi:hypothetical protein